MISIRSLSTLREAIWCYVWIELRARVLAPGSRLQFIGPILRKYEVWRVSHRATALLGHRWKRSPRRIEIDLTYVCNMRCNDCNRSVTQAPSNMQLTKADIDAFIRDSLSANAEWELVRLLGGEPTLHPEFFDILDALRAYRDAHLPDMVIEVISNGHGPRVNAVLEKIPADIKLTNTAKLSNDQPIHHAFNRAPCDRPEHAKSDFSNGCFVAEYSGTGLTPMGYYHCAVAGGIDRIFRQELGRDTLPASDDEMRAEMAELCRLCGHFTAQLEAVPDGERVSPTWKQAYAKWAARQKTGRTGISREKVPPGRVTRTARVATEQKRSSAGRL